MESGPLDDELTTLMPFPIMFGSPCWSLVEVPLVNTQLLVIYLL